MALVRFRGVTKRFGAFTALAGLDLDVRPGEVLGLLGPNGAGKTTALRILCGLIPPSEGTVEVGGRDVQEDPLAARRQLAFVPDGAPLYANLSARGHLQLVGRLRGMPEGQIGAEAMRLLDALDLAARADDPVGELSSGMRQKTALACALLPRPPLLILDEPLNGLDAPTTAVFKEVLSAWAGRGGAVLYTSHLLDVAERVCDRVAILADGRLVGLGTLDELRLRTGRDGTLEEVFGALTHGEDPAERARRLLG
jgi:ABC-2 type transport system ATP-binding protein